MALFNLVDCGDGTSGTVVGISGDDCYAHAYKVAAGAPKNAEALVAMPDRSLKWRPLPGHHLRLRYFPEEDWSYLGHGFLVLDSNKTIFWYNDADEDLELIRRDVRGSIFLLISSLRRELYDLDRDDS